MNTFRQRQFQMTAVTALLIAPTLVCAQELTADEIAAERTARLELMQNMIGAYTLTIGSTAEPVELRKSPVLRFTNPLRRTSDGGLFLWEHHGRPVALTCIYPSGEKVWDHEFQSLADRPIIAIHNDRAVWTPGPALQFKPIPNTMLASSAAPARRREMGAISRRFSARLLGWGPGKEKNDELRLQSAPVHRWGDPSRPVVDGGLFVFGEATDPEIALLIEAHKDGDQLVWKYALARVTSGELVVRLDDEIVWTISVWRSEPRSDQPYLTFWQQREISSN